SASCSVTEPVLRMHPTPIVASALTKAPAITTVPMPRLTLGERRAPVWTNVTISIAAPFTRSATRWPARLSPMPSAMPHPARRLATRTLQKKRPGEYGQSAVRPDRRVVVDEALNSLLNRSRDIGDNLAVAARAVDPDALATQDAPPLSFVHRS